MRSTTGSPSSSARTAIGGESLPTRAMQPGPRDGLDRHRKLGGDGCRGAVLVVRELGVGVQAVAERDRMLEPGLQRLQQLVEHGR